MENAKTGNIKCDIFGRFLNTMEEKIAGKFKYYHIDPFEKKGLEMFSPLKKATIPPSTPAIQNTWQQNWSYD